MSQLSDEASPGSPWVRKPHDYDVNEGAPLAEVGREAVLGGGVVQAAQEELSVLLTFFAHDW